MSKKKIILGSVGAVALLGTAAGVAVPLAMNSNKSNGVGKNFNKGAEIAPKSPRPGDSVADKKKVDTVKAPVTGHYESFVGQQLPPMKTPGEDMLRPFGGKELPYKVPGNNDWIAPTKIEQKTPISNPKLFTENLAKRKAAADAAKAAADADKAAKAQAQYDDEFNDYVNVILEDAPDEWVRDDRKELLPAVRTLIDEYKGKTTFNIFGDLEALNIALLASIHSFIEDLAKTTIEQISTLKEEETLGASLMMTEAIEIPSPKPQPTTEYKTPPRAAIAPVPTEQVNPTVSFVKQQTKIAKDLNAEAQEVFNAKPDQLEMTEAIEIPSPKPQPTTEYKTPPRAAIAPVPTEQVDPTVSFVVQQQRIADALNEDAQVTKAAATKLTEESIAMSGATADAEDNAKNGISKAEDENAKEQDATLAAERKFDEKMGEEARLQRETDELSELLSDRLALEGISHAMRERAVEQDNEHEIQEAILASDREKAEVARWKAEQEAAIKAAHEKYIKETTEREVAEAATHAAKLEQEQQEGLESRTKSGYEFSDKFYGTLDAAKAAVKLAAAQMWTDQVLNPDTHQYEAKEFLSLHDIEQHYLYSLKAITPKGFAQEAMRDGDKVGSAPAEAVPAKGWVYRGLVYPTHEAALAVWRKFNPTEFTPGSLGTAELKTHFKGIDGLPINLGYHKFGQAPNPGDILGHFNWVKQSESHTSTGHAYITVPKGSVPTAPGVKFTLVTDKSQAAWFDTYYYEMQGMTEDGYVNGNPPEFSSEIKVHEGQSLMAFGKLLGSDASSWEELEADDNLWDEIKGYGLLYDGNKGSGIVSKENGLMFTIKNDRGNKDGNVYPMLPGTGLGAYVPFMPLPGITAKDVEGYVDHPETKGKAEDRDAAIAKNKEIEHKLAVALLKYAHNQGQFRFGTEGSTEYQFKDPAGTTISVETSDATPVSLDSFVFTVWGQQSKDVFELYYKDQPLHITEVTNNGQVPADLPNAGDFKIDITRRATPDHTEVHGDSEADKDFFIQTFRSRAPQEGVNTYDLQIFTDNSEGFVYDDRFYNTPEAAESARDKDFLKEHPPVAGFIDTKGNFYETRTEAEYDLINPVDAPAGTLEGHEIYKG